MLNHLLKSMSQTGQAPGTLIEPPAEETIGVSRIDRFQFFPDSMPAEKLDIGPDTLLTELDAPDNSGGTTWIHCQGDVTAETLQSLGRCFNLHKLALEDVHNGGQRPKLDYFDDYVFLTLALPARNNGDHLIFEQVSIFLGYGFVLSFHRSANDVLDSLRRRFRGNVTPRSVPAPGYIAYTIADVIVDCGFELLNDFNDRLERLENEIFESSRNDVVGVVHGLRRELIALRKILRNQHEMLLRWSSLEHPRVRKQTRPFIRDAQDHARRVLDLADGYYDTAGSLLDTYLSLSSSRLNETIRVLTLVSTVFMPLSFLAGLYGMNFNTQSPWNLPELGWRFGYLYVLGVMATVVLGMLIFFRRRGWI